MWFFYRHMVSEHKTSYKKITPIPFIKKKRQIQNPDMSNNNSSANLINSDPSKQTLCKRQQNIRLQEGTIRETGVKFD